MGFYFILGFGLGLEFISGVCIYFMVSAFFGGSDMESVFILKSGSVFIIGSGLGSILGSIYIFLMEK